MACYFSLIGYIFEKAHDKRCSMAKVLKFLCLNKASNVEETMSFSAQYLFLPQPQIFVLDTFPSICDNIFVISFVDTRRAGVMAGNLMTFVVFNDSRQCIKRFLYVHCGNLKFRNSIFLSFKYPIYPIFLVDTQIEWSLRLEDFVLQLATSSTLCGRIPAGKRIRYGFRSTFKLSNYSLVRRKTFLQYCINLSFKT